MIYDYTGKVVFPTPESEFSDNYSIDYKIDKATGTAYTVTRIFQTKIDGSKQFPFVYAPTKVQASTSSALQMNSQKGFPLAMNAGVGGSGSSGGYVPLGVLIENGVVLQEANHPNLYELTIDSDGVLSYENPNTSSEVLLGKGVVSALCGFCPLVIGFEAADESFYSWISHYDQKAQRQIIGQYASGDYAIITAEGRDFDNSTGWTIPEAITTCVNENLKFAFNLDGGGSVETVIGHKQINIIYENQYGRPVPNYIVFNGTNAFKAEM